MFYNYRTHFLPVSQPIQRVGITIEPADGSKTIVPDLDTGGFTTTPGVNRPSASHATIAAQAAGLKDLDHWIQSKIHLDATSPLVLLGPTMDQGTYYFRLGAQHNSAAEGWGMDEAALVAQQNKMLSAGFPAISAPELATINAQYLTTLQKLYPDRNFVVKHFPGGNGRLETTEQGGVHFGPDRPIGDWINGFDVALAGNKQPWGVMLSHASYDLASFPGIDKMKPPEIPGFLSDAVKKAMNLPDGTSVRDTFSQVPASLNPFVTQYLRDAKHYDGMIVTDWLNMKAASNFCDKVAEQLKPLSQGKDAEANRWNAPNNYDVALLMGVMSNINSIRPQLPRGMNQRFWDDFAANSPDKYKVFDDKLNQLILDNYNKLKNPTDPAKTIDDIKKLAFRDKIELVTSSEAGDAPKDMKKDYQADLQRQAANFPDKDLFNVINVRNQVVANDIWDRTGVLTMQYRKSVIEHMTGKHFPDAPTDSNKEQAWFDGLMKDTKFKTAYEKVYGTSPNELVAKGNPTNNEHPAGKDAPAAPEKADATKPAKKPLPKAPAI